MKTLADQLSDPALLHEVRRLVQCEREATASLVAHLAEVYRRKLYFAEGCSSMFAYCTRILHLSENAAYRRIEAAQVVGPFPLVLTALENGALHLTAIRLLAPYLTPENCGELLEAARHRSKREVESFLARRFPRPDVPALVRKLPALEVAPMEMAAPVANPALAHECASAPTPTCGSVPSVAPATSPEPFFGGVQDGAARRGTPTGLVAPLAAERYKVQFTASAKTHEKLRRAQDLLRHRIPDGDLSQVFDLALRALVEKLEKQRLAATSRPRQGREAWTGSRTIPAAVKRAVWQRDGGRCAFVGRNQRRCNETGCLEFHHVVPFARGGAASIENIALRCRAHNQYEALLEFGPRDVSVLREESAIWGGVSRARGERDWGCGVRDANVTGLAPCGVREGAG